ncbi:MAG: 4'-phosphopantetheinyl transferase superfamily protein [Synechococcales bacterium]|nr:4'-phosphopantetheinyl transferase superfamily protein [Synechococcales bacterium]
MKNGEANQLIDMTPWAMQCLMDTIAASEFWAAAISSTDRPAANPPHLQIPQIQIPQIQLWQTELDRTEEELQYLSSLLSKDEKARAQRLKNQIHQQRFIAARGLLRLLIATQLHEKPDRLQFTYTNQGKPQLSYPALPYLHFNLSHAQNRVLYAISTHHPIGVDLEPLKPMQDALALAQRFFTPAEAATIAALPDHERSHFFLRYWTCKEAYLKATGDGLGKIQQLEIQLARSIAHSLSRHPLLHPATVTQAPPKAPLGQIWELHFAADWVGAIALLSP